MEDNENYTYEYETESDEKTKPEKSLKTVFAVIIAVFAVLAVLIGILVGIKKTNDIVETTTDVPTTIAETTTQVASAAYEAGEYKIATGGAALCFRNDHSREAETILEIADGTQLNITEIYRDEAAIDTDFEYWGKTTYLGHTGWVAMKFLSKAYSENVVLPGDTTTASNSESTTLSEATTKKSETTTSAVNETTTKAVAETTTSASSTGAYKPGDYKIDTDGSTLSFRKSAGTSGEKIMDLADGTALTVIEVVDTGANNGETRYWGKISYKGYTGYVCMTYLTK